MKKAFKKGGTDASNTFFTVGICPVLRGTCEKGDMGMQTPSVVVISNILPGDTSN